MIAKNLVKPIGILCTMTTLLALQGCAVNPTTTAEQAPPFTAEQARKNRLAIDALDRKERAIAHQERMRAVEIEKERAKADAIRIREQNTSHTTNVIKQYQ